MIHDLRYACRLLIKSPAFSAVAILSLALGIGANTAIFSLVSALLLKPVPVEDPFRLASVFTTDARNPGNLPLSHLNYKDLRDQNQVFSRMTAFTFAQLNWSTGSEEAEQIPAQVVAGNYFSLLGVQPTLGRGFLPEEDAKPTAVVVLSRGFWERSLGADPEIVGRTLTLNRTRFTVIGVAPKGFTGTLLGGGPSVWVPMSMHDVVQPNFDWYETRRGLFLFTFGRLKEGVTVEQAAANVKTVFAQLEQAFPNDNKGRGAGAMALLDARLNPNGQGVPVVRLSMILMTVVGIVLLIACANIANLLLARASRRRREIAVRLALGADRVRLVRQLLTESVLLSIVGAGLGLLLAYWLLDALRAANLPLPVPVDDNLSVDARVLAFTALLAVGTGLLFGLAPALQASKADVVPVLKNETVPAGLGQRGVLAVFSVRQVLVVSQVAASLVALIAAGLFVRSLRSAQAIDTGFETRGVLVMTFNLGREGYTPERGQLFYEQIAERAASLPGVQRAAVAQNAPLAGGLLRSVFPEGLDTTTRDRILVQVNAVSPGYLDTIGVPLLRGRDFTRTDAEKSPRVVIVNEQMARQFWPGEDAIGKRFRFPGQELTTIVGIARNAKYNGVAEEPIPFIYESVRQRYTPAATLHIRTAGDAAGLAGAVRREVQSLDPTLSVFNIRTLEDQVFNSLQPLRINVVLLSTFGLLALVLAAIGLYGVANYSVSQRTREIGVRMALGARPSAVLRLVLGQGLALVGIGLAIGLGLAFAGSSVIPPALLPRISARDPWTFAGTAALLAVVAFTASYLPARRATKIDPLIALRTE